MEFSKRQDEATPGSQNPFAASLQGVPLGHNETSPHDTHDDYIDFEKDVPRVLNQRYELKEELGKGAHGRIYSGRDKISK